MDLLDFSCFCLLVCFFSFYLFTNVIASSMLLTLFVDFITAPFHCFVSFVFVLFLFLSYSVLFANVSCFASLSFLISLRFAFSFLLSTCPFLLFRVCFVLLSVLLYMCLLFFDVRVLDKVN